MIDIFDNFGRVIGSFEIDEKKNRQAMLLRRKKFKSLIKNYGNKKSKSCLVERKKIRRNKKRR